MFDSDRSFRRHLVDRDCDYLFYMYNPVSRPREIVVGSRVNLLYGTKRVNTIFVIQQVAMNTALAEAL